ncbi:PAS domain-containing protein [Dongia sp.]|uniref:PAS domain-containing protein n=1 Tax=Dongia sp. TaxID=1977262 RepID=UPI003752C606
MASKVPTAAEIEALIAQCHPEVRAVVAYWRAKAGTRRMPARADIDPAEMKPYLPRVSLIDVVADERRFVYRLVGTEEAALRGYDPTGRSVGEGYFGPNRELAFQHYQYPVEHRAPFCYRGDFEVADGSVENEDVVFLPLSEDDDKVNMILLFYHDYSDHPRVEPSSVLLRTQSRKNEE